eukprot:UN22187
MSSSDSLIIYFIFYLYVNVKNNIIYEASQFGHFFQFLNCDDSRLKYFNEGAVRNIARQILSALSSLHDQNMLHNNISPLSIGIGNVFRVEKTLKI